MPFLASIRSHDTTLPAIIGVQDWQGAGLVLTHAPVAPTRDEAQRQRTASNRVVSSASTTYPDRRLSQPAFAGRTQDAFDRYDAARDISRRQYQASGDVN